MLQDVWRQLFYILTFYIAILRLYFNFKLNNFCNIMYQLTVM
jgi:hypothetical protein